MLTNPHDIHHHREQCFDEQAPSQPEQTIATLLDYQNFGIIFAGAAELEVRRGAPMDVKLINKVAHQTKLGRNIMMRRTSSGNGVLKVTFGPFGLLKKRYTTDLETWNVIREIVSKGPPGHIR